jgi:hypothetical protein
MAQDAGLHRIVCLDFDDQRLDGDHGGLIHKFLRLCIPSRERR